MVQYCVAHRCKTLHDKRINIPFHSFPFKRPEILQLWITALRRENWKPSRTSRLCSKHFKETDYQNKPGLSKKILKLDAVPSIFNLPAHLQKKTETRKALVRCKMNTSNIEDQTMETIEIKPEPIPNKKDVATQTKCNLELENVRLKRQLKTIKQKLQRKVKKVESMEQLNRLIGKGNMSRKVNFTGDRKNLI